MATAAEGLATRTAFARPQRILQRLLDDCILVSDDELGSASLTMIEATRSLVALASAAPLAAALRVREQLHDRRVALVCSGGNVSLAQLRELLGTAEHHAELVVRSSGDSRHLALAHATIVLRVASSRCRWRARVPMPG